MLQRSHAAAAQIRFHQFVEDQEQTEWIDRPGIKIVVAIFRIVEVKPAQLSETGKPRHDHLDIDGGRVMAEVDKAFRPVAKMCGSNIAGAPILYHRGIKRRFVEFVFDQKRPVAGQRRVNFLRTFKIAIEACGEILLARKIGPIPDPYRQRF